MGRRSPSRMWPCRSWRGSWTIARGPGRARHHRRRHLGRYRLGRHRGLRRPEQSTSSSLPTGPHSDLQRRQMTTIAMPTSTTSPSKAPSTTASAVKALRRLGFRDGFRLSGVNSINLGRIVAQIVYYFAAAGARRPARASPSPFRRAISATSSRATRRSAWAFRIERLVIATNNNDILARALKTGRYEVRDRHPDLRPLDGYPRFVQLRAPAVRGRHRDGRAHAPGCRALTQSGRSISATTRSPRSAPSSPPDDRRGDLAATIRRDPRDPATSSTRTRRWGVIAATPTTSSTQRAFSPMVTWPPPTPQSSLTRSRPRDRPLTGSAPVVGLISSRSQKERFTAAPQRSSRR